MKKLIKILFCFILIASVLCTMPAYANYNAVYEKSLTDSGDNPIYAQIYLLVNLDNDTVIFEKDADKQAAPASLTKIMTATVVLENCKDLDEEVEASYEAIHLLDGTGSSIVGLEPGEKMSIKNLLYCLLVRSGNDAANVLAMHVGGSIEGFVKMMNDKAAALGCKNTHFANVHGLDDPNHYTTARDLMTITKHALTLPYFSEITSTTIYKVPATNKSEERTLRNTNNLMNKAYADYYSPYAVGIKTGSTDAAGHCLVSSATRGSLHFISVVLGGDRVTLEDGEIRTYSFYDTNLLFNWAFDNFAYRTILEGKEIIQEVPVSLSKTDYVTVHPADDVEVLFPKDLNPEDLERVITLPEDQEAPITAGQKLGTMELKDGDTSYATVDLLASNDVEADKLMVFRHDVTLFFQKPAVRTGIVVVLVLIVLLLVLYFTRGSRRRRYGRSYRSYSSGYRGRHRR